MAGAVLTQPSAATRTIANVSEIERFELAWQALFVPAGRVGVFDRCGEEGIRPPPAQISARAFAAVARLIGDYLMPMAEPVYAAMLARWIISTHPAERHVRHLQREMRLQGLRSAEQIRAAAGMLVEADWLREPTRGNEFGQRGRIAYAVNPRLWAAE